MEELLDSDKPQGKIFNDKNAGIAIFLGGALAGGYIFSSNFKVFGEQKKVMNTWIIAIAIHLFVLLVAFSIPETVKIPTFLFFLVYLAMFNLFYIKFQKSKVESHISVGGDKYHWSVSLLIGIISLAINFVLIFSVVYLVYDYSLF